MKALGKLLVIAALGAACGPAAAAPAKTAPTTPAKTAGKATPAAAPKASGPVRAYKGPEGELVVLVEANEGTEMLVHLRKIGGDLEGKTLLYLLEDRGNGNKDVYVNKKRGSKTYRSTMLTARDGRWDFYHPTNGKIQFSISYSEEASEKVKLDEVLAAYQP